MVLVYSSEPTRPTNVKDRVTHALFEWIEFKKNKKGALILPNCVQGLNHRGLEVTTKYSKKIVLLNQT
jgi:hypothetical protein